MRIVSYYFSIDSSSALAFLIISFSILALNCFSKQGAINTDKIPMRAPEYPPMFERISVRVR
jgi:hypothetical protein